MDLANLKVAFVGLIDNLQGVSQNYTITESKILDIPVYGHVGVKMKYNARIRFFKKGEDVYMEWFNSTVDMSSKHGYFYFENLQSTEICDVNEYIDDNSAKYFEEVKPAYDMYCNAFINYVIRPIISAAPINKMFLP